jgi:hypothetical protein
VVGLALVVSRVVDGGGARDVTITSHGDFDAAAALVDCIIVGAELDQ